MAQCPPPKYATGYAFIQLLNCAVIHQSAGINLSKQLYTVLICNNQQFCFFACYASVMTKRSHDQLIENIHEGLPFSLQHFPALADGYDQCEAEGLFYLHQYSGDLYNL
jgi:hypothetical protein